jgi:hypothetical protein
MRYLIATPLFPPDTAPAAAYSKELARRTCASGAEVTVLLYGHLPESVPRATLTPIDKRRSAPLRLIAFTWKLIANLRAADHCLAINGPSTELPLLFASYLTRTPLTLIVCDTPATARWYRFLHQRLRARAARVITADAHDYLRPEIMPLEARPVAALAHYDTLWQHHCQDLTTPV